MYAVMDYKSINIVSARITDEVWRRYEDRNPMVRYVKKLDEIAWYSKLRYPTLDGKWDPGVNVENLAYLQQNNGYPESYRRVKFRYSYELAQGTPNSKSGTVTYSAGRIDGYEGGRLTLKEVREEGGPETAPVSLPPYLFTYQGQDIRYEWDNDDEWGYTKTGEHYMAPDYGVCWNLSEILLPACATIKVDLERDEIHSSLATLARMRRDFPCAHHTGDGSVYGFYPEPTPGAFYVQSGISNPAAHDGSATLSLESTAGLAPGMFCFVVAFVVPSGNELLSHYEHYYTYVIEDVDHVAGTVTLNQDVGENGHVWDHAKLYAIKESRLRCDGVRVSQVTVAPLYGDERVTSFTYPEGGDIRGLPPEAVPQLFVLEAQRYEAEDDEVLAKEGSKVEDNHYIVSNRAPFSGTGYRRWHSENQSALEWPNVYAPYNHVPYLLYIRYRVQGDETPRRDISVQGYAYEEDYVEFPINGNQWSMKCLAFEVGKYGRKKPEKSPGVKVHLNCRNREHMLEIDYIQVYPREGMTLVRSRPLELGIYDPHLFSGRRVIYPYVEVTQEPSGMVGKIRHRFYTYDDSVTLSPEGLGEIKMPVMHRVRSQTAEGLPLEQIIDHSAIVGAAKSIEFIDTSGEIVYTSKPTYRFSEDLNDHEGALFASLDNRLPADKPVGLVRERTVRMQHRIAEEPEDAEDQQDEDIWFVRRGVTDMIRSSLFMVREDKTYDRNGVTVSVRKGLFDAYRGAAMAELRTNYDSDGQKHGLLSIEAPTTYVETGNRLTGLKKKNIYTHSAFTMSAQPATVGFPLTIQEVIAQQNETGYSVLQAGATGWSVEPFDSSAEVPYDQWRYYKDTSYVWGGAPTFASRDLMRRSEI